MNLIKALMVLFLVLVSYILVVSSAQVLDLTPGKVLGCDHETKKGGFAEKPIPPKPWKGLRDGTKFGALCIQLVREFVPPTEQTSEDCLTLNIIRPKKEAPQTGFPILFWVHGGGYEAGSAPFYGYQGFADIYTAQDVIVVTIQYRLGVYGFFSTGDSQMPGNLGLWDMAEALMFIHANAENFGGDPRSITVWRHSAGSAAVGQLILSPITRDYIVRSIEMSGSPWGSWYLGSSVANNSLELAQKAVKKVNIGAHLEELLNDIVPYYVDRDEEQHFEFYVDRYAELLSDLLFVAPSAGGILARRAAGWGCVCVLS
ncbi:Carboxylesterase [Ancylostoma caninum]|uniref:Carboxylesterase n=1 Tax=Ancylostoma caninum TaxID=29170 RepID=A0A368FXM3_ANCCA|nr:Carboxylesterase [Ancylostoma caninum]